MVWQKNLITRIDNDTIKGIIFDFDGTLTNLDVNWADLKKELIERYPNVKETQLNQILKSIERAYGKEELLKAYNLVERYEQKISNEIIISDSITELLRILYRRQIKLAIVSNNMNSSIEGVLSKNRILSFFDYIIGKDSVHEYKPNPEGVNKILHNWKFSKDDVLLIGNDSNDEKLAQASSLPVIII